ncbi:A24 family peptidase [Streptomyces longispororuber]|uniref:A24 family peptidase n=1 Tax=Streptomyces longispororuber TaxID=68230 RepID=UPI0027E3753A|nr:A24 family peptidase [Streptomyces longispororuber]
MAAAAWGAIAGRLILPAAYRMAVPADTPWRDTCPAGHPLPAGTRGWLTSPRCPNPADAAVRTRTTVPALTALICALLAAATGLHPELLAWLLLTPPAILLALVDARAHRLPDRLTLPLTAATLLLLGAASLLPGSAGSWPRAAWAALVLGCAFFLIFLASPKAMGFGDVKLAPALGAMLGWYGWHVLLLGILAGYVIAAVHGLILLARHKATGSTPLPFGPPLLLGTAIGVALGATIT